MTYSNIIRLRHQVDRFIPFSFAVCFLSFVSCDEIIEIIICQAYLDDNLRDQHVESWNFFSQSEEFVLEKIITTERKSGLFLSIMFGFKWL